MENIESTPKFNLKKEAIKCLLSTLAIAFLAVFVYFTKDSIAEAINVMVMGIPKEVIKCLGMAIIFVVSAWVDYLIPMSHWIFDGIDYAMGVSLGFAAKVQWIAQPIMFCASLWAVCLLFKMTKLDLPGEHTAKMVKANIAFVFINLFLVLADICMHVSSDYRLPGFEPKGISGFELKAYSFFFMIHAVMTFMSCHAHEKFIQEQGAADSVVT
ncbi:hypothetical protein RYA05_03810 [Pseudomonas syringae pv. actinidiae]|nr:hypothetical protein [Pseudomonas syringae pv. actinidiae]